MGLEPSLMGSAFLVRLAVRERMAARLGAVLDSFSKSPEAVVLQSYDVEDDLLRPPPR